MAAYSAVTSLKHTIDRLLNSSRVSVASSTRQILDFACEHVEQLQHTLEEFDKIKNSSEGVMAVDARIRVEARKLEDAIDTHASTQLLSQSQSHEGCPPMLSINLDVLRQDIDCFAERATMIGLEYIEELHKPSSEMEDAADNSGDDCDMVGLSDQFLIIRDKLSEGPSIGHVLSISGMAGIGKTMLANKVFHDSLIKENFECRAFVRIGRKYQVEEVLRAILAQVNLDNDRGGDEDLRDYFKRSFMARKYLIVFDDIWDDDFSFQFETLLPDPRNGSWIVKISRDSKTAESFSNYFDRHLMRFMNQEESWDLLKREVFGEEECPYPLVKPGKKIAENCEGLPLLILSIAQILSKAQKNSKYVL